MGRPQEIQLTYADYRELPEDGRRYEIIHGSLEVSPSATLIHQTIVSRLMAMLLPFIEGRKLGRLLTAPMDVILSQDTVVQPDLLFIAAPRLKDMGGDFVHGAPDLVIEVLSPGTQARDRGVKRHLYARFGVREYWQVDPDGRSVTILGLKGKAYREVAAGTGDAPLSSSVLEGFTLVPSKIFQDI
jgi:Uma2 family endonuclease